MSSGASLVVVFFSEACFYGNFEIVKVLVENGANVNGNQNDERSPSKSREKRSRLFDVYRVDRIKSRSFPSLSFSKKLTIEGKDMRLCKNLSRGGEEEEEKTMMYYLMNLIEKNKRGRRRRKGFLTQASQGQNLNTQTRHGNDRNLMHIHYQFLRQEIASIETVNLSETTTMINIVRSSIFFCI